MTNPYGVSDAEFNLIKQQAARRAALRKEFMKQKTNPFKHASEAGYVVSIKLRNLFILRCLEFKYKQMLTLWWL